MKKKNPETLLLKELIRKKKLENQLNKIIGAPQERQWKKEMAEFKQLMKELVKRKYSTAKYSP